MEERKEQWRRFLAVACTGLLLSAAGFSGNSADCTGQAGRDAHQGFLNPRGLHWGAGVRGPDPALLKVLVRPPIKPASCNELQCGSVREITRGFKISPFYFLSSGILQY